MTEKTQAMRILEGRRIPYEVHHYAATETNAENVALAIGASPRQVYKTLVVRRKEGKPLLVMIRANAVLDLKKLARILGEKKIKMATRKDAERMTGLQTGGISALALINRGFDILVDSDALKSDKIIVSAGKRGLQVGLKTNDLISVTEARAVDISN